MVDSKITIVILTFNSIDHIESCIQSVLNQDYLSVNLSIVDNASSDGTVDLIRRLYPEISIKVLPCNLGFSKAHNLMISETSSEFYMPLNPDVRLTPAYLSELFRVMETQDLAGSVVGKIMFMKDNGEITNRIYSTGHLLTRSRSPTNRGYKKTDTYQYERLELIFAANGAAPLYRREMLEDISLDGERLQQGDEIGVFDGPLCVGAAVVTDAFAEYISIAASADDPTTDRLPVSSTCP